jgi:predicted acylesterase/phospholipase RssA
MEERLRDKKLDPQITLRGLFQKTKAHLTVIAADIGNKEMLILNHNTAPDCPVVQAVRMSMSIPFIWKEKGWDSDWGLYRGKPLPESSIVDGATLSNFPLRILVDPRYEREKVIDPSPDPGARTLGLLLDESADIPGAQTTPRKKSQAWQGLRVYKFASRLIETMTGYWDRSVIEDNKDRICFIPGKGIDALEFDMPEERMDLLLNSGRCAMTRYLQKVRL